MSTAMKNGQAAASAAAEKAGAASPHTAFPEIWGMLAREFRPDHIKYLSKGGKKMPYVTARTVMNRLDFVLGPENWWDEYKAEEHSVECRLTIRLPSGQLLSKVDAGGYAGMADQGDDDKSGYSDSFKRAAVKFGVARYLYGDGVPSYPREEPRRSSPPDRDEPEPPASAPRPKGAARAQAEYDRAKEELAEAGEDWREAIRKGQEGRKAETKAEEPASLDFAGRGEIQRMIVAANDEWRNELSLLDRAGDYKPLVADAWQAFNGVVSMWIEDGELARDDVERPNVKGEPKRKKGLVAFHLGKAWEDDEHATREDFTRYLEAKREQAAADLGINLDAEPAEATP